MYEAILTGSKLFFSKTKDKDYIILTEDSDVTKNDFPEWDAFIINTTDSSVTSTFKYYFIMTVLIQRKINNYTTSPYMTSYFNSIIDNLQEYHDDQLINISYPETSGHAWWYILSQKYLDGTFDLLTFEDMQDIVNRARNQELVQNEINLIIENKVRVLKYRIENDIYMTNSIPFLYEKYLTEESIE